MAKGKYIGFDELKGELASRPGVTDPAALASYIGRKKYGAKRFNRAARGGKRITEDDPRWNPRTMGNHRGAVGSRNASDGHGGYRPT
jgi:hypothetical protein